MSSDKTTESEAAQPVLAVPARVEPLTAMAGQFRKKPVVISAWLIDFTNKPLPEWVNDGFRSEALDWDPAGEGLWINTLVGAMVGDFGDWLIRGVKGELYACKPDVFEAAYEPAGAQPAPTAAPPEPHKSRGAVEHVVKLLTLRADDPMWTNHAEVSKVLLRNAAMYLRDHPALAATPPARLHAPLSDERVTGLLIELNSPCVKAAGPSEMFTIIVRAIEAAHGIGITAIGTSNKGA